MLLTFFVYNFSIFISVVFAWCYQNSKNNDTKFAMLILSFLPLLIVSAIRYKVGADFDEYTYIYNHIDEYDSKKLEPIYWIINFVLHSFSFHPQFVFALISFISLLFVFKAGIKIDRLDILLLIYALSFYLNSLNALRQETAICILIYAIVCLAHGENIKFVLYTFLATGFHYISLLFLPLIFLIKLVNFNKFYLFLVLIVSFSLLKISITEILLSTGILEGSKYQVYLYMDIYNTTTEVGTGLGMIAKYLPILVLFLIPKRYFLFNLLKLRNIVLIMNSLLLFSIAISINFYIFHRVVSLFSISLLFSILLVSLTTFKLRKYILTLLIILSVVFFEKDIQVSNKEIGNNKAISPYTTIFD